MDERMSRGEMIRRLDVMAEQVHDGLENGPLTPDERHDLAAAIAKLLPIVADELQEMEDVEAIVRLLRKRRSPATEPP